MKPDGTAISGAVKVTLKVIRGDQMIAFTDQEGRFDLLNVAPGEYTIEAIPIVSGVSMPALTRFRFGVGVFHLSRST